MHPNSSTYRNRAIQISSAGLLPSLPAVRPTSSGRIQPVFSHNTEYRRSNRDLLLWLRSLYHHIAEHLNTNNIVIHEQFGFRAGHSCEAQLISVVKDVQLAMDNTLQVDMIFIKFRKAFDTVSHCRLLN